MGPLFSVTDSEIVTQGYKEGGSFTDRLLGRLYRNDTSPFVVEGYVTSKRSIGKNLSFLDLQVKSDQSEHENNQPHDLCQALLRRDIYCGDFHDGYRRCLLKGCKLRLEGVASPTRIPGNVVLMVHGIKLTGLPRQSQHIQIILEQGVHGTIPLEEVIDASASAEQNYNGETSIATEIQECRRSLDFSDSSSSHGEDPIVEMNHRKAVMRRLKRLSKEILSSLPDDPQYPDAADQRTLSKEGNFMVPKAPYEWQLVPDILQTKKKECKHVSVDASMAKMNQTVHEALSRIPRLNGSIKNRAEYQNSVSVTGWVQNRRRFDDNITMIYLADDVNFGFQDSDQSYANLLQDSSTRLPCLLHPDVLPGDGQYDSGVYQNLIAAGSKVQVVGKILVTRSDRRGKDSTISPENVILYVEKIRLIRSSFRSVTIRHLLDLLYEKRIDPKEASEALLLSEEEATQLSFQSDATERQWKANLLAVELQKERASLKNRSQRLEPVLLQVLDRYKYLSKIHPVIHTSTLEEANCDDEHHENEEFEEKTIAGNRKRKRIALGMPGSRWQIKKKPQLQWMSQQIRVVLESHPDFQKRKLTILDIGGGKGQLANYLGKELGQQVRIHVVDISEGAIRNGKKKADRLDLPVDFQFADASNSNLLDAVDADVVVALHACGHLSDVALNHAVYRGAGFVIVPCCFNSNPHLMIPDKNATNKLTSVPDWLELPPGDWSALKLLAEVQDDIPLASEAIGVICALRAEAATKKMALDAVHHELGLSNEPKIEIKSFPIQFSTRNTVLVGRCS